MINAVLKVVGGKQDGKLIPLTTKKFVIGREQDCHLRPNSDSVSRHHCVISLDDFSVQVRDLGSSNGTLLNDVRVLGVQQAKSGDRLKIGSLEFEIVYSNRPVAVGAGVPLESPSDGTSFSISDFGCLTLQQPQQTLSLPGRQTRQSLSRGKWCRSPQRSLPKSFQRCPQSRPLWLRLPPSRQPQ